MKVAIVHDELVRKGGAEQVVLSMHKAFPDAPVYTLCYNPERTYPEFKGLKVITSWFQKIGNTEKLVKLLFFPFDIWAMRSIRLKGFDVVLVSTTHCAKYIRVSKNTKVVTYCHTPFRLAWRPQSYLDVIPRFFLFRWLFLAASALFRTLDKWASARTDTFLTNSKEVKKRIIDTYRPHNRVTIINPAVNIDKFYVSPQVKDYYLVVCRLEPYKKVDLVIEAFNNMPGKQLVVVGKGSMEKQLKEAAGSNIRFLDSLDARSLAKVYAEAKALVFPQYEDYGITPLEAAASGRPVIAYGKGGVLDTMIGYQDAQTPATALFFEEQTAACIQEAVARFETISFDPLFIRKHAEKFSESVFVRKLHAFVDGLLGNKKTQPVHQ